jgi:hypothetical protein
MRTSGKASRFAWARKNEEYIADFVGIARESLAAGSFEHLLFDYHFVQGFGCAPVCLLMHISPRTFFGARAVIVAKLGRAFHDTTPFPLYPLDQYFTSGQHQVSAFEPPAAWARVFHPVVPPLAASCAQNATA